MLRVNAASAPTSAAMRPPVAPGEPEGRHRQQQERRLGVRREEEERRGEDRDQQDRGPGHRGRHALQPRQTVEHDEGPEEARVGDEQRRPQRPDAGQPGQHLDRHGVQREEGGAAVARGIAAGRDPQEPRGILAFGRGDDRLPSVGRPARSPNPARRARPPAARSTRPRSARARSARPARRGRRGRSRGSRRAAGVRSSRRRPRSRRLGLRRARRVGHRHGFEPRRAPRSRAARRASGPRPPRSPPARAPAPAPSPRTFPARQPNTPASRPKNQNRVTNTSTSATWKASHGRTAASASANQGSSHNPNCGEYTLLVTRNRTSIGKPRVHRGNDGSRAPSRPTRSRTTQERRQRQQVDRSASSGRTPDGGTRCTRGCRSPRRARC